jgi:hypothetical protein
MDEISPELKHAILKEVRNKAMQNYENMEREEDVEKSKNDLTSCFDV